MKRAGNLFEDIVQRDNLRLAYYKAQRGKRARDDARQFAAALDANLTALRNAVLSESLVLGVSHQFTIYDPKKRTIIAPCFRERVLHHAIMNVCEPHFDRWLIDDTFACRRGKGRVAALLRARQFARRYPYFLKLDVRKYFESIDHDRLLTMLERRFKDRRLLRLFERIVRTGRPGVGLPIGSLTSQHFANFYLGAFDRWAKQEQRMRGYVRYMDDMLLWANSLRLLKDVRTAAAEFLANVLGLQLRHAYSNRMQHGVDWLGCRVYRTHAVLSRRARRRFCRKLRWYEKRFLSGELSEFELQQRTTALVAFARTEGVSTCRWRRRVLERMPVGGHGHEPGDPGRKLEQPTQELPVGEPQQELA